MSGSVYTLVARRQKGAVENDSSPGVLQPEGASLPYRTAARPGLRCIIVLTAILSHSDVVFSGCCVDGGCSGWALSICMLLSPIT